MLALLKNNAMYYLVERVLTFAISIPKYPHVTTIRCCESCEDVEKFDNTLLTRADIPSVVNTILST